MSQNSFTLIEILVVITIVAILSSFVLITSNGITNLVYDSKLKHSIASLQKAIIEARGSGNFVIKSCEIGNTWGDGCSEVEAILVPTYYSSTSAIPRNPDGTYIKYSSTDGTNFILKGKLSDGTAYIYDYELGFMNNPTNIANQTVGGTCTLSPGSCSSSTCWDVVNGTTSCYVTADSQTTLTRTWTELKYIRRIDWSAGGTAPWGARVWYLDVYNGSTWTQVDTVTTQYWALRSVDIGYNISAMRIRRGTNINWHSYIEFYAY